MLPFLRLAAVAVALLAAVPAQAIDIERVVSPGGIEAWLVSDDTIPLVAFNFAFKGAGASQDPAGKPGVAYLLSTLFDEGAGDLDSSAFQRRLDETAVDLSFDAGRDAFYGSMSTLSTRADEAFELLSLALQEPRFDADPIERMRALVLAGVRSSATDPGEVAGRLFSSTIFPDHPYGQPVDGTVASLSAITRDDLVAFRARAFARDNLVVGVVGDITAEELARRLDQVFMPLPAVANLAPVPDIEPVTGAVVDEALPNPQAIIRFGLEGLDQTDPDFMAAFVMNHVLGGGSFSSRLFMEVRDRRGLAYSVGSDLSNLDHADLFVVGTATSAAQVPETVEIIRAELRRMAEGGPTPEELEAAKRFLTGSYALRFDTSGKISSQLVGLQLNDRGIDYFDRRNSLIEAVTIDDVRRVAARLLTPEPLVVTVGPAG